MPRVRVLFVDVKLDVKRSRGARRRAICGLSVIRRQIIQRLLMWYRFESCHLNLSI